MALSSHAAPRYRVTDLGTLGGKFSVANGINNRGQVVGNAETERGKMRAFLWQNGQMSSLGSTADDVPSVAYDLNDSGLIVGTVGETFGPSSRGFSMQFGDKQFNLFEPDDVPGGTALMGVNNAGAMVGYQGDTEKGESAGGASGVIVSPDGKVSAAKDESVHMMLFDINSKNQVAGVIYVEDKPFGVRLPQKDGFKPVAGSEAWAINDEGSLALAENGQVVLWIKTAQKEAKLQQGPGFPLGINNRNQIVGNNAGRAQLYENRGSIDLNTLIAPGSGWKLEGACDINDKGQIVGYGTIKGQTHGFLLSPLATR